MNLSDSQLTELRSTIAAMLTDGSLKSPKLESDVIAKVVWLIQEAHKTEAISQCMANTIYTELVNVLSGIGEISVELYRNQSIVTQIKSKLGLTTVGGLTMHPTLSLPVDVGVEDDGILIHPRRISRLETVSIKHFAINFQLMPNGRLDFNFIDVPTNYALAVAGVLREIADRLEKGS